MELIFAWDRRKAHTNMQKHSVSFEEAKTIFNDPLLLTYPDDFHSAQEERLISIGYSNQARLLLVVHTEEEVNTQIQIRMISCRKATSKERQAYENQNE